ncbi:MAG: hypothetical protein V7638_2481 [Acidobacteriota bacterium]
MLSSVLNSEQAIEVNIAILRAFVKLRQMLESNEELNRKFAAVIRKLSTHDKYFKIVFDELTRLTAQPTPSRKRIGFKTERQVIATSRRSYRWEFVFWNYRILTSVAEKVMRGSRCSGEADFLQQLLKPWLVVERGELGIGFGLYQIDALFVVRVFKQIECSFVIAQCHIDAR